ncbi:hypothetical protein HF086_013180 [Spodoptera exigua]|uniref:PID domain-containing protein n=1 Tax=Spodoptera exigua TaxID=7107 RepID=A0A922MBE7_SPOEX|nr:hypothetical protein HF086_013180 [Spodoptera exigua]
MTEDEKQPCLNDTKSEIAVDNNESEVNNVKENSCTDVRSQLLSENEESVDDKNVNDEQSNEIVVSGSKINDVNIDEAVVTSGVITVNEDDSKKDVDVKTCNDSESNDVDVESNVELKEATGDSSVDDAKEGKGWRKPKSRTVMPGGSVVAARSPHAHDATDNRDEEALHNGKDKDGKKKSKNKEGNAFWFTDVNRSVLIEGVLFRARYLGSTQLACEGQPTKATRMLQAEEAVSRIKWGCDGPYSGVYAAPAAVFRLSFLGSVEVDEDSRRRKKRPKKNMVEEAVTKIKVKPYSELQAPEGENQPSTEVDLFISTEKIMVLNTELKEIMMDHALRTISYIADIGDLVVLMARRRFVPHENDSDQPKLNRTPKMICHVFESEEAQFIAQSIGQAFQVAYMEFLKANGIEDHSFVKEMDYQEVLNSQEIFGDELQMFAKKELQKEVVVPKTKGEILGVVVVESGWGSMLPTVVIANLAPAGAAARCGQLNIDLQPASRRYSGARRSASGTPHHRDQLAERRRRPARAHRQPTRHLRRRDIDEDNADVNVQAADRSGEPGVHITRAAAASQVPAYYDITLRPLSTATRP